MGISIKDGICDTKRQRDCDAFNFDVIVYVIFASSSEFDGDLILV